MQELPEYSNAILSSRPTGTPQRLYDTGERYHVGEMQRSWQSYVVSGLAHVCAAGLLLALTVPVAEHARKPARSVTLLAPVLHQPVSIRPSPPRYEAKLTRSPNQPSPIATPRRARKIRLLRR